VVARPLTQYTDELSRVESVRHRFHFRLRGLSLPDSKCPANASDLLLLNLEFTSGSRSQEVLKAYCDMLQSPPTDDCWFPWLSDNESRVSYVTCIRQLTVAMCDSWRRLHLPTRYLPLKLFYIAAPDRTPTQAADFLEHIKCQYRSCHLCMDAPFTKARIAFFVRFFRSSSY